MNGQSSNAAITETFQRDPAFSKYVAYGQAAEEIQEIQQAGGNVDPKTLIVKYPGIEAEIYELIGALDVLQEMGNSEDDPSGVPVPGHQRLGDFKIIREVGRGGMGVVYEAEQLSLARRVALKVLPFASVLDEKQRQRFKNEAMAAATLEHPNIVGVYSIGCERAVHFYAMQFIEGQTVADIIGTLQQTSGFPQDGTLSERACDAQIEEQTEPHVSPSTETKVPPQAQISTEGSVRSRQYFQSVVKLGIQAGEALHYAHEMGVVHRDIKPSNLIVDGEGNLWVTDFGLAMVESNPNLTMTGDILGTLRYMSPEQALAKRVVVDHRTDVYSLGLTLYELLTLTPAHTGSDRQELLRRLAFEEPIPPRRLNRAVPVELETVVLKALARNPADRYESAEALAEDLSRYLEDRPIVARRPGPITWTYKWAKRHRVAASTVLATTLLLMTTAGAMKVQHDQHLQTVGLEVTGELAAAEAALDAHSFATAETHLRSAEVRLQQAGVTQGPLLAQVGNVARKWSAKSKAQDRYQRFRRIHNNLHSTLREERDDTLKECLSSLKEYGVLDAQWTEHTDFSKLTTQQLKQLKQDIAESLFLIGWLEIRMNENESPIDLESASRRAIDYWNRIPNFHRQSIPALNLWIADAWDIAKEPELADSARTNAADKQDENLFDFYVRGEYERARDADHEAVENFSRALRIDPGHTWSLLAISHSLSQIGKSEVAEAHAIHALDRHPSSRAAYYGRGVSLYNQEKYDLAISDFEKVHELNPNDYLGSFWAGMALKDKGDWAAAIEKLRTASELNRGSAWVPLELAQVIIKMYRRDRSEEQRKLAIKQLDRSVENSERVLDHHEFAQQVSATAHIQRARLHYWADNLEAAKKDVNQAFEIANRYSQRQALKEVAWFLVTGPTELRDPQRAIPLAERAVKQWIKGRRSPLFTLGFVYYEAGKYNDAIETFQVIHESWPHEGNRVHFLLAAAYWQIGKKELARGWYERGITEEVKTFRGPARKLIGPGESNKAKKRQD